MRRAAKIVGATCIALLLSASGVTWYTLGYPERAASGPQKSAKVVVEKHASLGAIARRLEQKGIIEHPLWFRIYAGERGVAQKIRAGQYPLDSSMTPHQILDKLLAGAPVEEVSVTIPEGKNIVEVAELLDRAGVTSEESALEAARDATFCRSLGVPQKTLEGYLFPDTYRFRPGTPARRALAVMVHHGEQVYAQLKAKHQAGFDRLAKLFKFDDRDVILMASLVEKETAQPLERPRIAGVFLNRLRLPSFVPHVLQTDPTIVYGCTVPEKKSAACKEFAGRIRTIQLQDRDNPYNTYTHAGLPPGPIANPGRASIEAVLAPDATPYLYFVSKNDGTHYFSKTKAEHEAAVAKYQKHHASGPEK